MGALDRIRAAWHALTGPAEAAAADELPEAPRALLTAAGSERADLLEALEKGAFEEASGPVERLLSGVVQSGFQPRRNTTELLAAYSAIPILRQTVDRVSNAVASVRWRLFVSSRRPEARRRAELIRGMRALFPSELKARDELIKGGIESDDLRELEAHPVLDLLKSPNPQHTGSALRSFTQTQIDLVGEAFWWCPTDGGPTPLGVFPLPAHWINNTPAIGKPFYEARWKSFQELIPEDEMVWMKQLDPLNPFARGCGIGKSLADELDGDEWAAKYIASFFKNGATPDGIVGVPDADDEELKRLSVDWNNLYRGPWRSHMMAFLNKEVDVNLLQGTFKDLTVVELRKFYNDKVRETYGVPPEIVGQIEDSNRATMAAALRFMAVLVVVPRLEFLRMEQQERFLPKFPSPERLVLAFDDPIPEDRDFQLEAAKAEPATLTVDEWRDLQGRGPVGDGSGGFHIVPLNVTTVESLSFAPAPMETPIASAPAAVDKVLNPETLSQAIDILEPIPLQQHSDPVMERLIADFGTATMNELGTDLSFNVLSPIVVEHLAAQSTERISGLVHAATREALRVELIQGVGEGEGIPKLAARVRSVFKDADERRSVVIARTEVLRSSNFARWQGMAQSGLVEVRRWLTSRDTRVRFEPRDSADHVILEGQVRAIDRPFTVPSGNHTGATAMHPGAFGVAALDIQCRCTTIPVVAAGRGVPGAFTTEATDEELKAVDEAVARRRDRWERQLRIALRLAFSEQQTRMLSLLREAAR